MLKTLALILFKSLLSIITDKVIGEYSSSRSINSSKLIKKSAKFKNFKNPKFKIYQIYE